MRDGWTDRLTEGGVCNNPGPFFFFLKKCGDNDVSCL